MAGGGGSNRKGGSLDKLNPRLYHRRFHTCSPSKPPNSESFKRRQKLEHGRTYSLNIDLLQQDIFRLLYRNVDPSQEERLLVELILNIAFASKVVESPEADGRSSLNKRTCKETAYASGDASEQFEESDGACRTNVSPLSSEMADSGLETGSVSPQENTVSESSGMDLDSQTAEYISTDEDLNKIHLSDENLRSRTKLKEQSAINTCNGVHGAKSLVRSVLVESNSNSNPGTDATCSSTEPEPRLDSSGSSDENPHQRVTEAEEIALYETQVLSDPFYESDCESEGNERINSFVPTGSFEYINPVNVSSAASSVDLERNSNNQAKFRQDSSDEATNSRQDEEPNGDINFKQQGRIIINSCEEEICGDSIAKDDVKSGDDSRDEDRDQKNSSTSYYFIDASTLSDDAEVASVAHRDKHSNGRLPSYISHSMNCATSRPSNPPVEDQYHKFTSRKSASLQTGHERVAEFERELKLTEHLEPLAEPRKVKRVDSTSEERLEVDRGIDKEALAVEIKEADSGESTQPSPCPDNSTSISEDKDEVVTVSINEALPKVSDRLEEKVEEKPLEEESKTTEDTRRPSLIRRNTFELDSNEEKLSILRQEYERRQGSLVFQNSIPQYSGHRIDDDPYFDPTAPPAESSLSGMESLNGFMDVVPKASEYSTSCPPMDKLELDVTQKEVERNYFGSPHMASMEALNNHSLEGKLIPKTADHSSTSYLSFDKLELDTAQKEVEKRYFSEQKSSMNYPVLKSASDKFLGDYFDGSTEGSDDASSSLPVTLNSILEGEKRELTKRTKRDEATPIVSGGASTSDFSKPTDSPIVRRKTESTPIVSGGSVIMNEPKTKGKKTARMFSSMSAWVVDMSDCSRSDMKSLDVKDSQAGMSQSLSSADHARKPTKKKTHEKHGSLGFFVNLNDMDTPKGLQKEKKDQNGPGKQYCEFFIDMSDKNEAGKNQKQEPSEEPQKKQPSGSADAGDKKNIFSMFIDLNEPEKKKSEEVRPSDRAQLFKERRFDPRHSKPQSCEQPLTEAKGLQDPKPVKERNKPSVFMFIESDSPVVRRRTLSTSRPPFKRHSWNLEKSQSANGNCQPTKEPAFRREHKRAHSLSVDRGDVRRLQAKTSNSSHSLSEETRGKVPNGKSAERPQETESRNMDTSAEDVFEYDVRDTPPNSHVEIVDEEIRVCIKHHDYKELGTTEIVEGAELDVKAYEEEFSEVSVWDKTGTESTEGHTRKSETFDISSGSGPSPCSDNQQFELSDLANGEDVVPQLSDRTRLVPPVASKIMETHRSLSETIKKIECEFKSSEEVRLDQGIEEEEESQRSRGSGARDVRTPHPGLSRTTGSTFVRLSDLDKAPARCQSTEIMSVDEEKVTYRMSKSIPETSWIESKLVVSRTGPVRANPRRIQSAMSTSLPPKQKSPMEEVIGEFDGEGLVSESDLSSMQSSMGRSGAEGSTEETETSSIAGAKPYNRLGEDLLRMFLEEINPDVTIDVAGRRIRAHKCILSSRCQYFAAILSGGWIESAGNVIPLQGYSYNAVHFALCHIYSGESNIPDSISIVELATLADMLCLEGLKEVIGYTLKVKYCHLFHKPCQICAVGVLECMPLAAAYGLDEVYRKSLRWITRHFVRIWPCKAFATLPRELMEKCYHQHIVHMSTDTVLQTMMDCDKLLATLPNVRWAEPVFRLVSNLLDTSVKYLSENFSGVLGNDKFQALGRELTWNISRLEDNFLAAAERLPPEQACKSYAKLHKMLTAAQTSDDALGKTKWGQLFVDFLKKIQSRVEKCLVRDATRASRTTAWLKMDLELRRRIQELACLVILPHEATKRPSRHSNFLKEPKIPSSRSSVSRSLDLRRVKMAISEHNDKTTKPVPAVPPPQPKKPLNKPKTDPLERKMQEDKSHAGDSTMRPRSWPNKVEVKSRYLEPRSKPVPKEPAPPVLQPDKMSQQRRKIMISSSDSSRTSSPAMKRAAEKKPLAKMKLPIKKDVKALSSDSLTESNHNRTNVKKDLTSKSCGITRPESPSLKQKEGDMGLSIDSLAEQKKKPIIRKKPGKMDTSMSTDSLMTDVAATPKSTVSNKLSPTLSRGANKTPAKKPSPPMQQRSPLTVSRRPARTLENSTAASRSRAFATSGYQGSPSLRRSLLDAAKTPDVPNRTQNTQQRVGARQGSGQVTAVNVDKDKRKKEGPGGQQGQESPGKKSSPKSNGALRANRTAAVKKTTTAKPGEDKAKTKCQNGEPKQPTVGSRSGTFLKDEPTILKRVDMKSPQASV
ncbi:uncharacterized protein LOC105699191 isoform X2 [Orussus abietinus]|uniref:uncharacterized protein LOC105699191 isoform X2 n=1 Tax=Orussus abietinus TaxID=222816 RepID=UPI000625BCCE|nr:uncharacterized protein LOC105699191 isoform X2 [Orussus abietinus]